MSKFKDYSRTYRFVQMERRDGILQMTLHTKGSEFLWTLDAQEDLARAFADVGADRENRIVIMTGTGKEFSGPRANPKAKFFHGVDLTLDNLHTIQRNAQRLVFGLLDIEVPVIAAVNGPAKRHADLPLMCDIVIAANDVSFEDTAHFHYGSIVPGDGINIIYTMLLGLNRARYLMLTGQVLKAREAKNLGLVSELMPRSKLLPRAWQLARQLAQKPDALLRNTRLVLTHPLRKLMQEGLDFYLTKENLTVLGQR